MLFKHYKIVHVVWNTNYIFRLKILQILDAYFGFLKKKSFGIFTRKLTFYLVGEHKNRISDETTNFHKLTLNRWKLSYQILKKICFDTFRVVGRFLRVNHQTLNFQLLKLPFLTYRRSFKWQTNAFKFKWFLPVNCSNPLFSISTWLNFHSFW